MITTFVSEKLCMELIFIGFLIVISNAEGTMVNGCGYLNWGCTSGHS